jgi:hypothetical protein
MISGGPGFEIRNITGHVSFQPMRLDASGPPAAMNGIFTEVQFPCQFPNRPVGGTFFELAPGGPLIPEAGVRE